MMRQKGCDSPRGPGGERRSGAARIRAVFLDIDNTLLDFDEYVRQTMARGFAHFGLRPYEPYMYGVFTEENNALWRRIEQGSLQFSELQSIRWNRVFAALGIDFDGVRFEAYFRRELHESAIPVPGAYALLETLQGRCILCAASNGPHEQQLHRLELADMRRYFDHVFTSEQLGAAKPAKAFFDSAFQRMNAGQARPVLPEETLMIGDSVTSDIRGGRQYGMQTCYYRREGAVHAGAEADFVVEELAQAALCM